MPKFVVIPAAGEGAVAAEIIFGDCDGAVSPWIQPVAIFIELG
jgi:hypothetical protein